MGEDVHEGEPEALRQLMVEYPDLQAFLTDYRKNICRGGTFISSERKWAVGDRVQLEITFPGLIEPIRLSGAVSWARVGTAPGIGIEFDHSPERTTYLERVAQAIEDGDPRVVARLARVLMVEDNSFICGMLQEGISRQAMSCDKVPAAFVFHQASDGARALEIIEQEPVDLLFVDLYLPVLGGESLIKTARELFGLQMPIIAMSGGGQEAEEIALRAGADLFLPKPLRLTIVFEALTQLLGIDLTC